jgi:hypothetical protein
MEDVHIGTTFLRETDDPKYQLIKTGESMFSFSDDTESHEKDFNIRSLCDSCVGDYAVKKGNMESLGYHDDFINDANVLMRSI